MNGDFPLERYLCAQFVNGSQFALVDALEHGAVVLTGSGASWFPVVVDGVKLVVVNGEGRIDTLKHNEESLGLTCRSL